MVKFINYAVQNCICKIVRISVWAGRYICKNARKAV